MSRPGNCWDNAVVESFFATLKTELIHGRPYHTRQDARTEIFAYLEGFYNRARRHSTLGYLSPVEFEERAAHSISGVRETERSPTHCEPCDLSFQGDESRELHGLRMFQTYIEPGPG